MKHDTRSFATADLILHTGPENKMITLNGHSFAFTLDTADGLKARRFLNRRTGSELTLDGAELELDIDAAESRIPIGGWFGVSVDRRQADMNQELGYREGFMRLDYDVGIPAGGAFTTSNVKHVWKGQATPVPPHGWFRASSNNDPEAVCWARTHVALPRAARGKAVTLVLGGFGLFDFRYLRAFINGEEVGVRQSGTRWREPAVFTIEPSSPLYERLRFGLDNVIALQCADLFGRTERLDRLDPCKAVDLGSSSWPPQFEQFVTIGGTTRTSRFSVREVEDQSEGEEGACLIKLADGEGVLEATVAYRWNASEPVLRKFTTVRNVSGATVRVMEVRLGDYRVEAPVTDGEQGFPVHLGGELFLSLAHPSGWAMGEGSRALLRHFPGRRLGAGESLECMEAVYGAALAGGSRSAFIAHVVSRMRRTIRKHDRPYAIISAFGAMAEPIEMFWPTAEFLDGHIEKIAEGDRASGCHFDFCSIDFWTGYRGDLIRPEPRLFPDGLRPTFDKLAKIGTAPGLWYSGNMSNWTIGGNPVVAGAHANDTAYVKSPNPVLCWCDRAFYEMNATAFRHHLREGVRLVKFDAVRHICHNPNHDHLQGVYSTEASHSAFIAYLRELDEECPDVFLMLYWGFRSPWWLLDADTLFEPGLFTEGCTPSHHPALHVRSSVAIHLDQAHQWMEDVPWIGKDSLGVWFSDWGFWNSSIGKSRWQDGMVMDLCRGGLLLQPWSDTEWLSPSERVEMAGFIALAKARPECFANARPVIGDPWKFEPYGYCCAHGGRGFIAISNPTLEDAQVTLHLDARWGLADNLDHDIYRLHPEPARLSHSQKSGDAAVSLRPNEIVLLEIVPSGGAATPDRIFEDRPLAVEFAESSRRVEVAMAVARPDGPGADGSGQSVTFENAVDAVGAMTSSGDGSGAAADITLSADVPASWHGGTLLLAMELKKPDGSTLMRWNQGSYFTPPLIVKGEARIASEWTVFGPVAQDAPLPQGDWLGTAIPAELCVAGAKLRPQCVTVEDRRLDLAPLIGGAEMGKTAYVYFALDVLTEGEVSLGFGAEVCMTAWIDGQQINRTERSFSSVITQPSAFEQVLTVSPGKGRHLVAVRLVSSPRAAVLCAAGPSELEKAAGKCLADGAPADAQPVLGRQCRPTHWQAWRVTIPASAKPARMEFSTALHAPADVVIEPSAHWIPNDA